MRDTPLLEFTEAGVRTPAKLNLTLTVHNRRPDGYHELTSLMVAVDLVDELQLQLARGPGDELVVNGASITAGPDNLVLQALARFRECVPVPPVSVVLTKHIPAGAGLGGGSGNAAGMLAWLARNFGQPPPGLHCIAAKLGSDVPFFLGKGAAIARGRGEQLEPFPGRLFGGERPWFVLIMPAIFSSTAAAYGALGFNLTSSDATFRFDARPFSASQHWTRGLSNDLEEPVVATLPELRPLTRWLDERVRGRWRMTGSGSAFYVACFDPTAAADLAREAGQHFGFPTRIVRPLLPGPAGPPAAQVGPPEGHGGGA